MSTRLTKNWYRFHTLPRLARGLAVLAVLAGPGAFAQLPAPLAVTSSSSTVPYNVNPTNVPPSAGISGIPGPAKVVGTPSGEVYYADETADYGGIYVIPAGSVIPQPVITNDPLAKTQPTEIPYDRSLSFDIQGNAYFAAPYTEVIFKIPNENGALNPADYFDLGSPLDSAPCNNNLLCNGQGPSGQINNELTGGFVGAQDISIDPNTGTLYLITNQCTTCQGEGVIFTEDQAATTFNTFEIGIPLANGNAPESAALDAFGNYYYTDGTYLYEANINAPSVLATMIGPGYPMKGPKNRYPNVQGLALDAGQNLWINDGHSACQCFVVFPFDPTAINAAGKMGNVVPANQYVAGSADYGQFAVGFGPHNYVYDGEGYEPSGDIRQNVVNGLQFGSSPLGTGIFGDTANFTFNLPETVAQITAVTAGSALTNEFAVDSSPGTCTGATSTAPSTAYAAEAACAVNLDYNPIYPGARAGAAILADVNGNALGYNYLSAFGTGPQIALLPGIAAQLISGTTTVAGLALNNPRSVVVDGSNNIFIADTGNARIVEIPSGGQPVVLATGSITLINPVSLALDGAGNLYIADSKAAPANAKTAGEIVEVTPKGVATIIVATGTPFYAAQGTVIETLGAPTAITVDNLGDLYIVNGNGAVLRQNSQLLATIVLAAGTQFSGNALNGAAAISTDSNSTFYIADTGNNRIVSFNELSGATSVLNVGSTTFSAPSGLAEDAAGNLYVADASGITLVEPSGTVQSVPFGSVSSAGATGVAIDPAGDIIVADGGQNSVFDLIVSSATLAFGEQAVNSTSPAQSVTLFNIGNAALNIAAAPNPVVDTGDTNFKAAGGTCAAGSTLAVDATCTLSAAFTPQTGGTLTGMLILSANTATGSVVINLTGVASSVAQFAVTGLPAQAPAGGTLNFTVTAEDAQGNPLNGYVGTVTFSSTDKAANLPANYTFTAADNSSHQFQVTFNTAGEQTITVTDTTTGATGTGGPVNVQAAAAAIAVSGGSNQSTPLGQPFPTLLSALVTDSANNPVAGALVTFTAPASGASGTFAGGGTTAQAYSNSSGIATAPIFSANGTLGSYVVKASVSGVAATANFNLTNSAGLSTTSLKVSPASPSTYGQPITLSATVSIPGSGSAAIAGPTGSVTFNDGTAAIATVALVPVTPANGTSVATVVVPSASVTALSGGTHSFTAVYGGDTNYQSSTSTPAVPYTISLATVTVAGPATTVNGVQGQTLSIPITVTGEFSGPGITAPTGTITSEYCVQGTLNEAATDQCGDVPNSNPVVAYPPPVVVTAPVVNGMATITYGPTTPANVYDLGITYSGDVNYQPVGVANIVSLTVTIPGFSFTPNQAQPPNVTVPLSGPPSITVVQPASGTATVSLEITPEASYGCGPPSGTSPCTVPATPYMVTFACTDLPKNFNCSFLPTSVSFDGPDGSSAQAVVMDVTTVSPPYVSSNRQPGTRARILSAGLFWLPGILFAGCLGFRRRQLPAWGRGLLAMFVLGSGLLGLGACSGMHQQAANGTYNFTVSATGTTTAGGTATLSIPVKMTVQSGN